MSENTNANTDATAAKTTGRKGTEKKPAEKTLSLSQKLLAIQKAVDGLIKDGKNTSDKYDFASGENVLERFRPLMNEHSLLLIPRVTAASIHEGTTRSGTARFLTELHFDMTWLDAQSGETLIVPWYAQGVDLAGEKGVGKAATYAEKYFLLKFFHVPTRKDDPDNDRRTRTGERPLSGTAGGRETADFCRKAVAQIMTALYGEDAEKVKAALLFLTKSNKRGYAGVDSVEQLSDAQAAVTYAKAKKQYEKRMNREFVFDTEKEDSHA
mgnify:CR=1 FL=1